MGYFISRSFAAAESESGRGLANEDAKYNGGDFEAENQPLLINMVEE